MNRYRLVTIIVVMAVFLLALFSRLVLIQVIKAEEYAYFAVRQQTGTEVLKADRGSIYDRNYTLLAYNRKDVSFYVNTKQAIKNKNDSLIARAFADSLGKSFDDYMALIHSGKSRVCIERKLDPENSLRMRKLRVDGLDVVDDPSRVYHYNELASHILGFVNYEYTGIQGIEKSEEESLRGVDGSRKILKDAAGNVYSVLNASQVPVKNGNNIVLTINREIQSALEIELQIAVEESKAEYATGIIMNPATGEILALANYRGYNPNFYGKFSNEDLRNKALTDTYEPGSTFKAISMAVFLDKGVTNPNEVISGENGVYRVGGARITDAHPFGNATVKQIFAKSSNIGMAKLSERIDKETLYLYYRNFGFGNTVNCGLTVETKGNLPAADTWSKSTKYTMSYGYGISVTPLQLISAYCALVNGGKLMQPFIIREIVGQNGEIIKKNMPTVIRDVISPKVSETIRDFFSEAVNSGTGKKALVKNVAVGGKTGTSRKIVDGKYSREKYNASFIGFFPVEKPKYVILIMVNSPKSKSVYGGDVAAPVFRAVAERIIDIDIEMIDFREKIEENEIDSQFAESGFLNTVPDSLKEQMELMPKTLVNSGIKKGIMPDLKGVSIREAIYILNSLNIEFDFEGSGKIITQSIAAGSKIRPGMKCSIKAQNTEILGARLY
ncbi:MAG: transpeptidase family protein [Ignavibacteriaceae bacterium]|nr:transpeptidase family protein [Ignavibacteriaceae bacterium]